MSSKVTRLLLCCGCLGGLVFFVGDMAFRGDWGSGASFTPERIDNVMASVAPWRLYLGSVAGPGGIWFELLGMLGLWYGCRRAAPRLAALMLLSLYTFDIFGISPHGQFGPVGFALRYCGSDGMAAHHIMQLNGLLSAVATACLIVGLGIWMLLALGKLAGVPRWAALFCPLVTMWLVYALAYVPEPIGFPLVVGWKSLSFALFFAVLAFTYKEAASEG